MRLTNTLASTFTGSSLERKYTKHDVFWNSKISIIMLADSYKTQVRSVNAEGKGGKKDKKSKKGNKMNQCS